MLAGAQCGRGAGNDAEGLAAGCGIHRRYAREWLEAMGLLIASNQCDEARFVRSAGVQEVLVGEESASYLLPLVHQMSAARSSLRALEGACRNGGGEVGWNEHCADVRNVRAAANREPSWRHLPWIGAQLGAGKCGADVGCGYEWTCAGSGGSFSAGPIEGFDLDGPCVEAVHEHVRLASVADRVSIPQSGIATAVSRSCDIVLLAERLHGASGLRRLGAESWVMRSGEA